jgi:hypothetical protein
VLPPVVATLLIDELAQTQLLDELAKNPIEVRLADLLKVVEDPRVRWDRPAVLALQELLDDPAAVAKLRHLGFER